jgi:hypothetical protein
MTKQKLEDADAHRRRRLVDEARTAREQARALSEQAAKAVYELRRSILESAGRRVETSAQREDRSVEMAEVRQVVREYIDHQRSLMRGSPRLHPLNEPRGRMLRRRPQTNAARCEPLG